MTHKHEKHVHCEHEEVAFCGHCEVVYCKAKGCGKEWSDCQRSHYSNWYYTFPQSIPCGTTTTGGTSISSSSDAYAAQGDHGILTNGLSDDDHEAISCSHGN